MGYEFYIIRVLILSVEISWVYLKNPLNNTYLDILLIALPWFTNPDSFSMNYFYYLLGIYIGGLRELDKYEPFY